MPDVSETSSFRPDPSLAKLLKQLGYVQFLGDPALAGDQDMQDLLGNQLMLGSNEILEEDLYVDPPDS